jgi:5-methylcytosine-specific restriction endonuclease McrA
MAMPRETLRTCQTHGMTAFILEGRGYYRCKECRKQRVLDWRRRAKLRLIAEAGGACVICGYDRSPRALHFHHVDPRAKEFALGGRGLTRGIERLRVEAKKCVLLCSNCHAEVEAGVTDLPPPLIEAEEYPK